MNPIRKTCSTDTCLRFKTTSASGRQRPVETFGDFPARQPAKLTRTAESGQKRTSAPITDRFQFPIPMTVEQTSVVDIAYIDRETGIVHLIVTDHLQWEGEHLLVLQEKINGYLSFVESGKVFDTLPGAEGKNIQIELITKYKPTEEALHFFGHAEAFLRQEALGFTH
jgi:hypothetical protein